MMMKSLALAAVLLLASTSAFAPPSNHKFTTSPTALQAHPLERMARVARANINNFIAQFEDPEKVMNQAVGDMQNDLIRIRKTYSEVTATQRRMASQKKQLDATADDWYGRAQLALRSQNEGLAREALARREQLLGQAENVQQQIDAQASNIDKLYDGMQALEAKIKDASSKKSQMAARARTAKSTQKVNDMLSGLTGGTSMDAFNRMEEKVVALEAAAEVSAEMGKVMMSKSLPEGKTGKVDLEAQFRRLEASSAVDKELEKLKGAMLPPASPKRSVEIRTPSRIGADYELLTR